MNILIAADKFKGSMTADEVCRAIADGIGPDHVCREIPIADGGEGMAAALTAAHSGQWIETTVRNAIGEPVTAGYGIIDEGQTAVIEMAEASGLVKAGEGNQDPWRASTFGTGELIRDAITREVTKILLGIGGSATNDGGTGMAEALGFQFLDKSGGPLSGLPENLTETGSIIPPANTASFPEVIVACDVTNPLLGANGCTRVYGPQKGIKEEDFAKHEARLEHLVTITEGKKFESVPGAGAAGGLGFGALVFLNASLQPGFEIIAKSLQLEEAVDWTDVVITGEGKIDTQSLQGKAPAGVAHLAKQKGKPVFAFCGLLGEGDFSGTFDEIREIDRGDLSVEAAMQQGPALLAKTVAEAKTSIESIAID